MPITNFPAYTGTALSRNLTQTQFDEAEEYFQAYQAAWAAQMNDTTIPQLNALETACTNSATTATTKAGEALISANNAGDSATLAGKWASEAVDVVVQSGKYSAFHWATKAYEYVATLAAGAINDSITALNATWSSSKISGLFSSAYTDLNAGQQIYSATEKTTLDNADELGIWDSVSMALRKVTIATLKTVFATLNSPTFTGNPTAPTPLEGDNSNRIPTTAFVQSAQKILQTVYTELTTSGTGTGTFPYDGTVPQQTEGNEILTLSITPKSASSNLLILVQSAIGEVSNTGNNGCVALFRDSGLNAIAVCPTDHNSSVMLTRSAAIVHSEPSLSTTTTTFKLRVGIDVGPVRWNGNASTQYYGAADKTTITIMEVL